MKTEITELLGIRYPIIQGGMPFPFTQDAGFQRTVDGYRAEHGTVR